MRFQRRWREPSCKNLLRKPLVLGVPLEGLLALTGITTSIELVGNGRTPSTALAAGVFGLGYVGLRVASRFLTPGWIEPAIYALERKTRKRPKTQVPLRLATLQTTQSDTFTEEDFFSYQSDVYERLLSLKPGERLGYVFQVSQNGTQVQEIPFCEMTQNARVAPDLMHSSGNAKVFAYSLINLPIWTDPTWFSQLIQSLPRPFDVVVVFRGIDFRSIKSKVEGSRKRNSEIEGLRNIDSQVSFEEATEVLEGLSRGEERLVEASILVVSPQELELDPSYFRREKNVLLCLDSMFGARTRFFRSQIVRILTACDLMPLFLDSTPSGATMLHSLRGTPLEFDAQDPRLEALHWLVVGTTGTGKSFFVGTLLSRMMSAGQSLSVLFLDHNRSFRRLTRVKGGQYLEPEDLQSLKLELPSALTSLEQNGSWLGVELSDLPYSDKKAASQFILGSFEAFLRNRSSLHPIYLVLDECWNFLRDEPVLVQRAFREFRKLNGAAIAITQSLSDFLRDETGASVFQNSLIRVLLRQGQDLAPFQGLLTLNDVEMALSRRLSQRKGVYSECLIKTPFLSRAARLYPTAEEHELLRTDNLRSEWVLEARKQRGITG